MMHAPHDPNSKAILHDNCGRCASHAESLLSLDDINLYRLWDKMLTVEVGNGPDHYDSVAEANACRALYATYVLMERLGMTVTPKMTAAV